MAQRWVGEGAEWLHIVNLDGAFDGTLRPEAAGARLPVSLLRLRDIATVVNVPIQFGGGVRSVADIEASIRFYRDGLDLPMDDPEEGDAVTLSSLSGTRLALFPRKSLAADATVSPEGDGFRG